MIPHRFTQITIYGLDILRLKLAQKVPESILTLALFNCICLFLVFLLFTATDAALTVAGFCKDVPAATAGEDQEKLAFRQILAPLPLYPLRLILAVPIMVM